MRIINSVYGHLSANPLYTLGKALLTPGPSQVLDVVRNDPTVVVSLDLYGLDAVFSNQDKINLRSFESMLFLILLDLATSNFYSSSGAGEDNPVIPFIELYTGRKIKNPFWHHTFNTYRLIVDYETMGLPDFGDQNGNGFIDPDEIDVDAILSVDDQSDNPYGFLSATSPTRQLFRLQRLMWIQRWFAN